MKFIDLKTAISNHLSKKPRFQNERLIPISAVIHMIMDYAEPYKIRIGQLEDDLGKMKSEIEIYKKALLEISQGGYIARAAAPIAKQALYHKQDI